MDSKIKVGTLARVWRAGQGTFVITLNKNVRRYHGIELDDDVVFEILKVIKGGVEGAKTRRKEEKKYHIDT